MKKVLLSLLVLGVAPCFGQQAPNPTVEELTALQQKVNSAFERHDSLSEVEKETLYTSCELATHLYGYLKAKEGITVPDSINVEALCKKVTGKKILAAIQVKAKDLKSKEDEFDNLLNKLKTSEKNKEFEEATQKITELKGEMAEECATLDKLLISLKENGTVP